MAGGGPRQPAEKDFSSCCCKFFCPERSEKLLIENSFSLPSVKIIKLDRDRQVVELLCQLYGEDGFNRMDEFINDNALTADEIVCLPMGREVKYYV